MGYYKEHHQTVSVVLHFHLNMSLYTRKMGSRISLRQNTIREFVETHVDVQSFNCSWAPNSFVNQATFLMKCEAILDASAILRSRPKGIF